MMGKPHTSEALCVTAVFELQPLKNETVPTRETSYFQPSLRGKKMENFEVPSKFAFHKEQSQSFCYNYAIMQRDYFTHSISEPSIWLNNQENIPHHNLWPVISPPHSY